MKKLIPSGSVLLTTTIKLMYLKIYSRSEEGLDFPPCEECKKYWPFWVDRVFYWRNWSRIIRQKHFYIEEIHTVEHPITDTSISDQKADKGQEKVSAMVSRRLLLFIQTRRWRKTEHIFLYLLRNPGNKYDRKPPTGLHSGHMIL